MSDRKLRVGILFGGRSAEHEVSLQSAKNIIEAIDRAKYIPVPIGVDKSGRWLIGSGSEYLLNADDPKSIALKAGGDPVILLPEQNQRTLCSLAHADTKHGVDVIFPIIHGTYGEDGTLQGLLRLADIPFVGADVLGSSAGMDKDVMKRLFRDAGIPIAEYLVLRDFDSVEMKSYARVKAKLGAGVWFVKPANLGSSVGIRRVTSESEYLDALDHAFQFDRKLVVEEGIAGREIECAVLGNESPRASELGEIIPSEKHGFYSYDAKYIDEDGAGLVVPADIPDKSRKEIQKVAIQVFQVMECSGMARVDVFLTPEGRVIANELNTLPGFTRISMYPRLWEASGVPYTELISTLIELALERHEKNSQLKTNHR